MKLRLNLSLRRALMAAMAVATTLVSSAWAGVADARYDLQYYLDFCRNKGVFAAGSTNIDVYFKDGSSVQNPTIPIMPNLDGYAWSGSVLQDGTFAPGGGVGLVNPQYVASAHHCGELNVYFLSEGADTSAGYTSSGYTSSGSLTYDWNAQRLNKIVTEVTYNPLADSSVLANLKKNDWIYRLGNGGVYSTDGYKLSVNQNAIGGMVNVDYTQLLGDGETWRVVCTPRKDDESGDVRPPLEIGVTAGDSGSPNYVWDEESQQFLFLGFISQGNPIANYGAFLWMHSNPNAVLNFIDKYTDEVSGFSADSTIIWGAQDASTGQGVLSQGDVSFTYRGKGTANTDKDTYGLLFNAEDADVRTIELQGSVNMGAGSLTFDSGNWVLAEKNAGDTFNSAGFVVNSGAELTLELTGTANEEWRKVGEGTMTIAGEGNNEVVLRVGGGTTKYDVTYDENGNIAGCTLGNIGETRLDRDGGYAASSVRLEAGAAIIVLMQDGQFKTNSVGGDTFTFGNDGGLLNLNGHDLTWGVINQDGSGVGARIGNKTPLGEETPGLSTFTYTGTGTFAGCFVDEGASSTAQLAVVYNNASGGTWKLTGNNSNVGGYTVEKGTLVLEGYNTPHVNMHDANDWSYATLEGSDVTVKAGATFQLSHHALMTGDVIVNDGASFIMNQAVNADAESIHGSLRQDMVGREITSLVGDVHLHGNTSMMTANVQSSAITKIDGNVSIAADYNWDVYPPQTQLVKDGNGVLVVTGNVNVPSVQINAGGLVIESANRTNWNYWSIGEQGFLAANGVEHSDALVHITKDSAGVFALTKDQGSQLNLSKHTNLYIGAWGDVSYGAANTTEALTAYNNKWLLGGGTGTLTVNFRLTGENDLIIGNDYSSGTVHLTNTQNDFTGEIIIKGSGNKLTFEQGALSSNAGVTLTYGNALALYDADQISIVKNAMNGAKGVLALATSDALNMGSSLLALGADGDFTYTGALSVDSTYRFGGSGNLTIATELDGSKTMEIDGQGTTGSSVTFAREQAFTGAIVAGAGLGLADKNSAGDISIHVGHAAALAAAESIQLQKGATLHTDGNNITVQNLTAETGSFIRNDGATNSMLELSVTPGVNTSIADGVLDGGDIHILKTGEGTLTLGSNRTWSGGLTIAEGTVKGKVYADSTNVMVGLGSEDSTIYVDKDGVLELNFRGSSTIGGDKAVSSGRLSTTLLPQRVAGTGTIRISAGDNGGTVLFSNQNAGFSGTMEIVNNTRLYIGHQLFESIMNQKVSYNNVAVFNKATVDVKSGSQVRLTNQWIYGPVNAAPVVSEADFIIAGHGFAGADDRTYGNQNNTLATGGLTSGALSIDLGSVINGTVTLADHATIASHSHIVTNQTNKFEGYMYGQVTYGLPEGKLGGTIRGQILGEGKDLTFAGEEGMTITADSANTYRNLIIASSNGHRNDDKFALNLDGGQAVSQTSTALGTGTVTLGKDLILRLAGTGVENNTDVVYTYENTIDAGNNATLQSYNITNVLSGTVKGDSLNLATGRGGVLQLAGGVKGSGTLNVAAGSRVILGSAAASFEGTPQFSGTVVAGAGADITLASPAVVAADTTFSGTDSLTLSFGGTEDYTLGGISVAGENSALTLHFDFTQLGASDWTTLSSAISAGTTTIALDLNMFNEMASGEYTLISGNLGTGNYVMDSSLSKRFSCQIDGDNLILVVGGDDRLYWSAEGSTQTWEGSNWQVGGAGNLTQYSGTQEVMLTDSGLSTPGTREVISLNEAITVGQVNVTSIYGVEGAGALTGSKLVVGNGGDFLLGVNATFSNGVRVNDATLTVQDRILTSNISAEDGAEVTLNGTTLTGNISAENGAEVTLNGTTQTGNVNLMESSTLEMTNAKLTGEITPGSQGSISTVNLTSNNTKDSTYSQATLSGSINAEGSSSLTLVDGTVVLDGAVSLDSFTISAGKTATVWNAAADSGAEKKLDTVVLGAGATLQTVDRDAVTAATKIGTLQLDGATGTLQDKHHSGSFAVETLQLGTGVSEATLNLTKNAASTWSTLFTLGSATAEAGNFAGTIRLNEDHSGSNRSAFIILANGEIARNAVISFADAQSSDAVVGLGINTDSATIAGLESHSGDLKLAKLFSGTVNHVQSWASTASAPGTVGDKLRTLTINTAAREEAYKFYGEVLGNLNLVIDGAGTQSFMSSSANFNGSLTVKGGALALNADSKSMLTTSSGVTVSGGTLDLSAIAFGEDETNAISLSDTSSVTFSEGSSIAFGALEANKTYSIFSGTGVLDGWNVDVLSLDNVTIAGKKLTDMYREGTVSLYYGLDGSFTYNVENATLTWQGGNGTWDTTTANWDITPDVAGDSTTFYQNDNVVFRDTADTTVTLSEDIVAGRVDIQDTYKHTFKGAAKSLVVDTLTSKGMVVVGGGDVFSLTINESSDIDGDLDVYWGSTLNLKGLNHDINKLITRANSTSSSAVNFNALSATIGSIEMKNKSAINFGLAEGATTASYTVTGAISINTNTTTERSLSVASGVSLQAGSLSNTHGLGTLDVDGSMTISGELSYTSNANQSITGDGTLTVGSATFGNGTNTLSVHTFTVNGATDINSGALTIAGGVVNLNGTTTKTGGTLTVQVGELNFNGPTTLDSLSATGGTTNFNGATTLTSASFNGGTVNFASNNAQVGAIVRGSGNINFKLAEGLSSTTYTVGDITGTCSGNMTVESGVTVNANSINYNGDHFVGGSRTLTVDGVLALAGNLSLAKHAASGETITGTGILNVGGNANISIHDGAININVAQLNVDGNLSMGTYAWGPRHANLSGGITTVKGHFYHNAGGSGQGDYLKLNINGGSLVMQGGATISKGELNIVSGSLHQAGGTSTISNTFSMTGGELKVTGGTMSISSTPTVSGGAVSLTGGSLSLTDAAAEALMGTAGVTFTMDGGTLDLSALTFDGTVDNAISLSSTAGLSLSSGIIAFGNLEADTIYQIFSFGEGRISGWDTSTLSAANFSVGGTNLATMGEVTLFLGANGTFSYTMGMHEASTLYWDGGATGDWNMSASNWDATAADGDAENNKRFFNGDSVIFATDAAVTVANGVEVDGLTIQAGKHLTTTGAVAVKTLSMGEDSRWTLASGSNQSLTEAQLTGITNATLEVAEGATLTMTDKTTGQNITTTAFDHVEGAGDVVLNLAMDNGIGVNTSKLTGDIIVATGRLQVNACTFNEASTIRLETANSQLVFHGTGTNLTNDVEVKADNTSIYVNSGKSGTISGVISGAGGLNKQASGTLTFAAQNTYTGVTTISDGKIVLDLGATDGENSTYTLYNKVTGGTLEVAAGTTLVNNGEEISSTLILNGGHATLSGGGQQIKANVTVKNGAVLTTTATDTMQYGAARTLTVEAGGLVDFGATRQTFGGWTLSLKGGEIRGAGAAYGQVYVAAMDYHDGPTHAVNALEGNSKISATSGMRGGTMAYSVAENATLTVSGAVQGNGSVSKSGVGDLIFTTDHSYTGSTTVTEGTLALAAASYTTDGAVTIAGGTLEQRSGSTVIDDALTMTSGKLKVTGGTLSISSTPTVSGGEVSISGGELVLGSGALLEGVSSFTLSGTGELDLSAITFGTDATNAIALKSNAVFTFSDTTDNDGGLVFDLGSLTEGVTYQIFDLNADNTTLNGWNAGTLDLGNFRINGTLLNEMENAGITLGEDGTFSYTLANENNPDVLYWVGGETGTWNAADAVWNTNPDDMEDENTVFSTDAHVAFNTSAAVDIAGSVQAASVAVEGEDTTLSLKSGSLTVADMYLEGTLNMASGVTLTVNNTEEVSISGITGSGTLVKAGSSTLELGEAELVKLSLQSGATNVTGEVTLSGQLSVGAATLNIESGAVVTANQLTGGNEGDNHPSSININGGELYITGSTNYAMNNDSCTSNSILLAHWQSSNTVLTLNSGKLVAEDAVLNTSRDSKGTFKALGGEATLLGIDLMGHDDQNRDGQFDLGTAMTGSAVVTLGSRGIKNVSRGAVVNLGEGTLKASADFSIDGNNTVSLIGTVNGTIFDTNAHNVTVNTVLTGSGKLVKNGAGELTFTKANTYSGATTINGGSIVLDLGTTTNAGGEIVNSEYTLGGTVSGSGTFAVSTGTTLNVAAGKTLTADLLVDGGVVKVSASDNQVLAGDITVQNGGRLTTSANNGTDAFSYKHSADTGKLQLVVDGGTVDFGSTRQTIKNWDITLKNGARLEGTGGSYTIGNVSHKASIDVLDVALTVNASGAGNEIAGSTRLRGGQTITYNVAEDADLTVSGLVHSDGKANQGNVVKSGDGKLVMTAANTYANTTSITGGTLELQGAGQVGSSQVSIASGAQLTAATTATADTESETWASISAAEGTTATLSAATVTQTESSKTLNIAAKTAGTQGTMTNSLVQIAADASLTVDSMIISASSRISGSTNYAVREAENYVSQLSLTNSVVELADSNVTIAGPSTASALTLQTIGASGEALNLADHSQVLTITSDALSSLTLTGGSSFVIDFSSLLSSTELADVDFVALNFSDVSYADDFWTNATTQVSGLVGADRLVAYYMPSTPDVGIYFDVRSIPEPTSTTLSLLALAALASRRRRK